jgi:SAM-dependent methyltransferase
MGEMRGGEIEFTDDELDELGIELAEGTARPKKKPVMRVPLDEVPRARKDSHATIRQVKFTPSDLAVETAFEKLNGAAKKIAATEDSPWDAEAEASSEDGAEDIEIDEDLPSSPTAVSAAPEAVPDEISTEMTDRYEDATDVSRPAVAGAPLPSMEDDEDSVPISSSPPYVPASAPAAAAPPAPPPLAAGPAAAPLPPPVPAAGEEDGLVLSSSPPPDRAGPRVAVGADTSGKTPTGPLPQIAAAPAPAAGPPLPAATPPPKPVAPPKPPVPAAASEAEELATEEIEEVSPPRPAEEAKSRPAPPAPGASAPPPVPVAADAESTSRRRRRTKQWFEEIFDEDYLRTLPYMTARQTEREAAFIVDALGVQNQANLLDVACGYGRHAMELAARGHKVTGLDLSLPLLIRAADAARRVGVNVNFVHGDMRELSFDAEFDAAYSFFTSFGYFDDDSNRKVIALVAKALKPGGRFLLDVANRDYLIGDLPTRVWWQGDGCVVLEEVDFNYFTSRLQVQRSIVFEDGRQVEQEISIRAYTLHEIGKVLHHAGFRVIEVSGGLATRGRFFGNESRQLMVVAEKKKEP